MVRQPIIGYFKRAGRKFLTVLVLFFWPGVILAAAEGVVINEVAWMGTKSNSADEWLELFNGTTQEVDLTGWQLHEAGGETLIITLGGKIPAQGYFLIERTDDNSVADVAADIFGPFGGGGLNNNGENMVLKNSQGQAVDQVNAASGWPAGDNTTKATMERRGDGAWQTNDGLTINGHDVGGLAIMGTPRAANSGTGQTQQSSGQATSTSSGQATTTPLSQSSSGAGGSGGFVFSLIALKAEAGPDVVAEVGQTVSFDASFSQGANAYRWYLGDGNVKDGAAISHSYSYPGTYLVTLEASNSSQTAAWDQARVYVYGGKVLINEFKPALDGWVEFYNPNNSAANISGWILENGNGKFVFPAFVVIPAKGFLALSRQITGLDWSGGRIILKYPDGTAADEVVFEEEMAGLVAARGSGGFYWTKEATPGAPNIVLSSGDSLKSVLAALPGGSRVSAAPDRAIRNLAGSSYNEVVDSSASLPAEAAQAATTGNGRLGAVWGDLPFWIVLAVLASGAIGIVYAVASRRWRD